MNESDSFRWLSPGDPPFTTSLTEGCWDWIANIDRRGYGYFNMTIDGRQRKIKAHRASYRLFVGSIASDIKILHSCDRPICVQPFHLRPGSQADNILDAVERNRFPVGEARRNTKLTEREVLMIKNSPLSATRLAAQLGVCQPTVSDIRRGVTWKHV